jgi:glycosyltransferase involved in cell wall biosynthesis
MAAANVGERRAVVIAGMHRSGTSALARVLSLLGLELPKSPMAPTAANEFGHWGESELVWSLHQQLLAAAGTAWDDVSPFPHIWLDSQECREYRARMLAAIRREYPGRAAFVLKDPRICRLIPFWIDVLSDLNVRPLFVLPFRNPLEVAASLQRRDGFSGAKGLLLWLRHVLDAERDTRRHPRTLVTFEDLLRDWRSCARSISTDLNLGWPRSTHREGVEIERFLSAELRHHHASIEELRAREDVVRWVSEAYAVLLDACTSRRQPDASRLDRLSALLADADLAYGPVLAEVALDADKTRLAAQSEVRDLIRRTEASEKALSAAKDELAQTEQRLQSVASASAAHEATAQRLEKQREALQRALASQEGELLKAHERSQAQEDRLGALESALDGLNQGVKRLASELESREEAWRKRDSQARTRQVSLQRELASLRAASEHERASRLGRRASVRVRWLRARIGQRIRSTFQLGSWVLNPFSRGRPRHAWEFFVLRRSGKFDPEFYLSSNPNVAEAGMNPLMHYLEHGHHERRDPTPKFSTSAYLDAHPDLLESGVNPLYHSVRADRKRNDDAPVPHKRSASLPAPAKARAGAEVEVSAHAIEAARRALDERPLSVSVVIPTYNRAAGLLRAVRSVLSQSYSALEIIVSDDGSTDGTGQMLRTELSRELEAGEVRYVRSGTRLGVSAARNRALEQAKGDLVAYLDSDNTWHSEFLLLMAGRLAEDTAASTAYCGFRYITAEERVDKTRFEPFDRQRLLTENNIDLNGFIHRRRVYEQLGGFDESMTRLVDWDLIIRYTKCYPPGEVPLGLVNYYSGRDGNRITHSEDFESNAAVIRRRVAHELVTAGVSPLRIAYVLWDYPAMSQTFVMTEIRELIKAGYDVHVYYHSAPDKAADLDFDVPTFQVKDAEELALLLSRHRRTMLHSHFAYPAVTLLTYPAAIRAGIPFTFMVHAVDIFHRKNASRNRIDQITQNELCVRVLGAGEHHRSYLIERGVPAEKIAIARQASEFTVASEGEIDARLARPPRVISCIARFAEKKGIDDLIRAGARLGDRVEIRLYGYGPLEAEYRRLAAEVGGGRVLFAGALEDRAAVAAALAETDIFALPCVIDANGDMDGLPTVIGEAMAAGVPVVTTDVSSIPEIVQDGITGFLVPPREPETLARKLQQVIDAAPSERARIIKAGIRIATEVWNTEHIIDVLLDAWERPPVDISLVTFSRNDPDSTLTTGEILRRIHELTTTPFHLTVVDNASDQKFTDALRHYFNGRSNASLILLDRNTYWGPALNLALRGARSEFPIYVCSNEGFPLRPGWEREYLDFMRAHRDVAIAGHLVSSPGFPTGADYVRQEWFKGVRNKAFAESHPDREFFHVQGGFFVLRRSAFEQCGGFSQVIAQDAVDIEYSYLVESCGWTLGRVGTIPSVTRKTRPAVQAHLDDNTKAAHPLTLESLEWVDRVARAATMLCNICGWTGAEFESNGRGKDACPRCHSTPFGRLVYRYLAGTAFPYRGLECLAITEDEGIARELSRMFELTRRGLEPLRGQLDPADVVVADLARLAPDKAIDALRVVAGGVRSGGTAIVTPPRDAWPPGVSDPYREALSETGLEAQEFALESRAVRFPPGGLIVARRPPDPT